jgi:hypothetical protein
VSLTAANRAQRSLQIECVLLVSKVFSIDRVCSLFSDSSEPGARILKNQRPGKFALEIHSILTFDIFGQHCAALNLRISIQEPPGQTRGTHSETAAAL